MSTRSLPDRFSSLFDLSSSSLGKEASETSLDTSHTSAKKRVSFAEDANVTIPSSEDELIIEDIDTQWYTMKDYIFFKSEIQRILRLHEKSHDNDIQLQEDIRGLECHTPEGAMQRLMNQGDAISLVLKQQRKLRRKKDNGQSSSSRNKSTSLSPVRRTRRLHRLPTFLVPSSCSRDESEQLARLYKTQCKQDKRAALLAGQQDWKFVEEHIVNDTDVSSIIYQKTTTEEELLMCPPLCQLDLDALDEYSDSQISKNNNNSWEKFNRQRRRQVASVVQ